MSHMCFSRSFWHSDPSARPKKCRMKYIWIDGGTWTQDLYLHTNKNLVVFNKCHVCQIGAVAVFGYQYHRHWLSERMDVLLLTSIGYQMATQLCARCIHNAYGLCFVWCSEEETAKRCIEAPLKIIDLYILTQEERNGLEWFWDVLTLQVVLNLESSTSWKFCSCKDHPTGQGSLAHPFPTFDFEQPSCLTSTLTAN